jgi:hypothetical protein
MPARSTTAQPVASKKAAQAVARVDADCQLGGRVITENKLQGQNATGIRLDDTQNAAFHGRFRAGPEPPT